MKYIKTPTKPIKPSLPKKPILKQNIEIKKINCDSLNRKYFNEGCYSQQKFNVQKFIDDLTTLAKRNEIDLNDLDFNFSCSDYCSIFKLFKITKSQPTEKDKKDFDQKMNVYNKKVEQYHKKLLLYKKQLELYAEYLERASQLKNKYNSLVEKNKDELNISNKKENKVNNERK